MKFGNPYDDGHADLSDYDSFSNGVPHRTFHRMRGEDPLQVEWLEGRFGFLERHSIP